MWLSDSGSRKMTLVPLTVLTVLACKQIQIYGHHNHPRRSRIDTCEPCVGRDNNRLHDSYRACDLVSLKQKMNETLREVGQIMEEMANDHNIDFSATLLNAWNVDAYYPLGSMLRLAYSTLQNMTLRAHIISNYPARFDIQIDLGNTAERFTTMLCDIDRILRSGSFYWNTVFPSCSLQDHSFSNGFQNFTRTDLLDYVVNFVVYSRNNLEFFIGNINNILLNI